MPLVDSKQAMNQEFEQFRKDLVALLPRLQRFARVLTHSPAQADDLMQASIERALSRRHQWKPDSRLDAWVFTILHSIWKNELRAQSIRRGQGFVDPEYLPDGSSESNNERTILLDQVFDQVNRLPEEQRKAILLVYVEGYAYREAADILEIPSGTLMSRLARARGRLASDLDPVENQQADVKP